MLKVIARPWLSFSKQILIRSFKRGTVHPCRSRGCKNIRGQSWRSKKICQISRTPGTSGSRLATLAIFFATSNFDLKYFCNLLTYKNVQYLIWKIWFISVWSQKSNVIVWLLTCFMLGQCTHISYHTEANKSVSFLPRLYLFRANKWFASIESSQIRVDWKNL